MARRGKRAEKRGAGRPHLVFLLRRPGAPRQPTARLLAETLGRAWSAAPRRLRPRLPRGLPWGVNLLLVGDAEIAELNTRFLRHPGPTDVLAFPLKSRDPERRLYLLGEVVCSYQTAAREARARGLPLGEELARYAAHGFLHLLGYRDASAASRRAMERAQERALRLAVKCQSARPARVRVRALA